MKKILLIALIGAFFWIGCSEKESSVYVATPDVTVDDFSMNGFSVDSLNAEKREVFVKPKKGESDSLTFKDIDKLLEISGGAVVYKANSSDEEDPEIVNWEVPIENDVAVPLNGSDTLILVVLDESNSVTDIWKVVLPKKKLSSSSKQVSSSSKKVESSCSSSELKKAESSSSLEKKESSSSQKNSSSSSKEKKSSSSVVPASSSSNVKVEESSSSVDVPSSSTKKSSSSSEKNSSSSETVSCSSEEISSSSEEIVVLSTEKEIVSFQIWVSGVRAQNTVKDDVSKTISLKLATTAAVDSVQMFRLTLSEGASASVPLKSDLVLTKVDDYTYEYAFSVAAEDGSSDDWKIIAEIPKGVKLCDFAVDVDESVVSVNGNKIYVELPYDSTLDLTALKVLPMDTNANLLRPLEMEFVDENDELQTYTVVAGMQLPGTSFKSQDLDFWGTTSTAMGISGTAMDIKISSSENLEFSNSTAILTSRTLLGETGLLGIDGSQKLAGGFYFTGSYSGVSALYIYDRENSGSTPSTGTSDISKDMNFGRRFQGRPESFTVDYSYVHVKNSSSKYPQKSLIYVLLVSDDGYVVAGGSVTDSESVTSKSVTVPLEYGGDAGVLSAGYPISQALKGVDGSKEVAYIHVMFASSAYAHVVAGGTTWLNDPTKDFRGGEGSQLILDSFRLNY